MQISCHSMLDISCKKRLNNFMYFFAEVFNEILKLVDLYHIYTRRLQMRWFLYILSSVY